MDHFTIELRIRISPRHHNTLLSNPTPTFRLQGHEAISLACSIARTCKIPYCNLTPKSSDFNAIELYIWHVTLHEPGERFDAFVVAQNLRCRRCRHRRQKQRVAETVNRDFRLVNKTNQQQKTTQTIRRQYRRKRKCRHPRNHYVLFHCASRSSK